MARDPADNVQTSITAHSTALVALDSDIRGTVAFGPGCIVHPKAIIHALNGNIIFGKDCVVEETAKIVYRGGGSMRIGEGNIFMIGSRVECPVIGNYNTFQPRSTISGQVEVSDHCTIAAGSTLEPTLDVSAILGDTQNADLARAERLETYTVVYGASSERRKWDGKSAEGEDHLRTRHIEYLREILPKYNRMRPV